MKKIKYTFIIPVYNCEAFVERCINSITNQFEDYEVLVIDDGSSDKSGVICDNLSKSNDAIKVYHNENKGISFSRNYGLEKAKGKYILFLDADDYYDKNYYEHLEGLLAENKEVQLFNFGFISEVGNNKLEVVSEDKITYKDVFYKNKKEMKKDFVDLWDNTMLYNIWNKVYLSSVIKENNIMFPNYNWGEDVEFNRLYLDATTNMLNSSKTFYHYVRERVDAVTKKYKDNFFVTRKQEYHDFNEYFESWEIKKDDYIEYSSRRFSERVLGCIENEFNSNERFIKKYKKIKLIVNDDLTRKTIKASEYRSSKIKVLIMPIKYRLTLMTIIMIKMINIIKRLSPALFNKMKNKR